MGINGLLPYLAQATKPCHISEFRGGTVAVDSYCLLHKGCNACAEQLARGEDSQMYVNYCIKYVKLFLSYDIHPIMVFDGRNLPAKAETEAKRRESRKKAKQRAAELLKLGKTEEARTFLKQCIDVTPKMAHNLIRACRELKVDCIVAPYESDAQLAFFNIKGVAECVITEDSDLILFGCKKVLYKLDLSGAGRLVEAEKIPFAMKMRPDQFTFEKFRYMCILSGCDYVNSLSGIGLKKAEKFLKLTAETNPEKFLDRIPRYLKMQHLEVTEEYKRSVLIANATFLHQIVFDPYKKKLVHLTDPDINGTNPDYLINAGDKFDNLKALQVAMGNLNPYTFEVYDEWEPSDLSQYSIWSGLYTRVSRKQEKRISKLRLQEDTKTENDRMQSIETEEERVREEEYEIEKDLAKYTQKIEMSEEVRIVQETKKQSDESEVKTISPVLSKNPFLRKNRLSKFPKTYTCGSEVVRSRFFSSCKSRRTQIDDNSECQSSCDIDTTDSMSTQQSSVSNNLLDDTTSIPLSCESLLKSNENMDEIVVNEKSVEAYIPTDVTDYKERTEISEDYILQHEAGGKLTDIRHEAPEAQHESKRRKLGSCQTVCVRKKFSSQQTLHTFFGKLKKSD